VYSCVCVWQHNACVCPCKGMQASMRVGMQRLGAHSNRLFRRIPQAATTSHPRVTLNGRHGAYCHNSEAVPRMHPRRHLPQGDGKCKDVGLERHADILLIRHFAPTAHVTAGYPAGTCSCSGDMKAGVPLKPVFDTVSTRFSTRATPADRFAFDPAAARESSSWTAHQSRRCTFPCNHASL
jgi:hypothetical protein